jgi:ABC-2 type transport system ATP-binding protein
VGCVLDANFHPGRTGRNHLRVQAAASGVSDRRVDELLELVGIPAAARKRAGGYTMGMRQRLGLAAAMLGDPHVLILDEPANGLDPEGIRWLRGFLRHLADEGRTLLISSHMLSEVEQTVDDVVIIANGKRVAQGTVEELRGEPTAYVRTSDPDRLTAALQQRGLRVAPKGAGLQVTTEDLAVVGDVAHATDVAIHELRSEQTHLEELFFNLTETEGDRNRLAGATSTRRPGPEPAVTGAAGARGLSSDPPSDLPPPSGAPVDPSAVAASTADAKETGR